MKTMKTTMTFEKFCSWLKAMNRYEFFVSLFLGDDKLQDCRDFFRGHGENTFSAMAEVAPTMEAYEECRRLDILFDGYLKGYPVYVLDLKKTVIAALYKSDDISSVEIDEFQAMYPGAKFDEDCFAVYAYKLERILKKIG